MKYAPHTEREVKKMLEDIGVSSIEELFSDIPYDLRAKFFDIPQGKSELEVLNYFKTLALKNYTGLTHFLGAGFYDHYIPAAVDYLTSRGEFSTPYTPYQPECSQGILQSAYEYQTLMCELTDMEVSNASLYDGGTALFEAVMMALRINGRNKVIMDSGINLIYRTMLYTYTSNLSIKILETPSYFGQCNRSEIIPEIDEDTSCIILQNPNFFGFIDDYTDIVEEAHKKGALVIELVYPISLSLIKTPGEIGVDIAVGEGQSLGIPLSFGSPYLGFMTTKEKFLRKMPGRIVGETVDKKGRRGFVLTLQAREQHIRRERATSNICTNSWLCALRACIYISLLGKEGLKNLAQVNLDKAEFTKKILSEIPGVRVERNIPSFNEFPVILTRSADEVVSKMVDKGFSAGFPLGRYYKGMDNYLLVAVTEKRTKEEIVKYKESMEQILLWT